MDQITFHHDTVLSDIHMLLPNARHLMTRLNCVGQPVFVSKFKILSDGDRNDNNDPGKVLKEADEYEDPREDEETDAKATQGKDGEDGGEGRVEPSLDEDGDLDITHRPRKTPTEGNVRDTVCPIILKQSGCALEEEEDDMDDEDKCFKDIIRIEHTMATPLEDVGKQVWRGAFLLADFILSEPVMFRGATVLELGAGTGLTSIVMATTAKTVYCTDRCKKEPRVVLASLPHISPSCPRWVELRQEERKRVEETRRRIYRMKSTPRDAVESSEKGNVGEDLLSMCERNVSLNRHIVEPSGGEIRVRQLDWLQHDLCTDADVDFSWTEEEIADMYNNTSIIIAADVCYDDDLTDGLFRTLYRLCSTFTHTCTIIIISLEKRMNFTVRHMDVSCEAYDHFRRCLSQLQDLVDGRCSFRVEQLPSNFSQFFLYERIEQLELWKVTATLLPFDPSPV